MMLPSTVPSPNAAVLTRAVPSGLSRTVPRSNGCAGVYGLAMARNPSHFRQGRDDRNELDKYADMDDAKAAGVIASLVSHQVTLVPTFFISAFVTA